MKTGTFILTCWMLVAGAAGAFAECAQIITWADEDNRFFDPGVTTGFSFNEPHSPTGNAFIEGYSTTYASFYGLNILWSDRSLNINSYESEAQAREAFDRGRAEALQAIEDRSPYLPVRRVLLDDGDSLLTGDFDQSGESEELTSIVFYSVYRNCIMNWYGGGDGMDPGVTSSVTTHLLAIRDQAKALIDSKCGGAPNREPIIGILPLPTDGFSFQISILKQDGFQLVAYDPDGYEDLLWDTFAVIVNGIDVTDHFLQTLFGAGVGFAGMAFDPRTLVFYVMPDPKKLMGEHNLFNIQQNGEATVQLQICDTAANCTVSPNRIYFGPFFALGGDAFDRSCDDSSSPQAIIAEDVVLGNVGLPSTNNDLFVGLRDPNNELNVIKAYSFTSKEGVFSWEYGIITRFTRDLAFPTGMFTLYPSVILSMPLTGPGFPVQGAYSLVTGIEDNGHGTEVYDRKPVLMCRPQ